jgi:hypothetical protein
MSIGKSFSIESKASIPTVLRLLLLNSSNSPLRFHSRLMWLRKTGVARFPGRLQAPICSRFASEHLSMQTSVRFLVFALCLASGCRALCAQLPANSVCPRPQVGGIAEDPEELRSQNGVLEAELTVSDATEPNGSTRYCYKDATGRESPTLRVNPGDLVVLRQRRENFNSCTRAFSNR